LKQVTLLLSKRNQFSYAALPVASARHAGHRAARRRLLCVARLVTWLVAPLVVDYSASRRLVVDYFASVVHPGASAHRAARHAARRAAVVDYSASRRLIVDYFASAARPGASARSAARHAARRAARHRLLRIAQDRRRLLRLAQARRR
jgi:hypothetical protein